MTVHPKICATHRLVMEDGICDGCANACEKCGLPLTNEHEWEQALHDRCKFNEDEGRPHAN